MRFFKNHDLPSYGHNHVCLTDRQEAGFMSLRMCRHQRCHQHFFIHAGLFTSLVSGLGGLIRYARSGVHVLMPQLSALLIRLHPVSMIFKTISLSI